MMNAMILHSSASCLRQVPKVSVHQAQVIQFYTLSYQDLRMRQQSGPSSDQLEKNLLLGEVAVDGEVSSVGSTVTAKGQTQEFATAEPSIIESAPTEIINKILNILLEQRDPDTCTALCFGLTSRRNWAILRNLDHTSYLKEHMDHIPGIIDFKCDKIPLFNPCYEDPRRRVRIRRCLHVDRPLSWRNSAVSVRKWDYYFHQERVHRQALNSSQWKQFMLFKEWMGPKYRLPTSQFMPCYLSCAVYGESGSENIKEKILEDRFLDFLNSRPKKRNIQSPFGLGDSWVAVNIVKYGCTVKPDSATA
ncbi:hypothetical protein EAE96_004425 [Botrytis aclada]|nr:hypothetical protein EAE96_004425 [Botrytis aclada]